MRCFCIFSISTGLDQYKLSETLKQKSILYSSCSKRTIVHSDPLLLWDFNLFPSKRRFTTNSPLSCSSPVLFLNQNLIGEALSVSALLLSFLVYMCIRVGSNNSQITTVLHGFILSTLSDFFPKIHEVTKCKCSKVHTVFSK